MNGILLLLGTNLGDRLKNLENARNALKFKGVEIVQESSIYQSEPWGKPDQPWFLNMVVEVNTVLSPYELLEVCLAIETELGRKRKEKWGERLIDIDILFYKNQIIDEPELIIPHPGIAARRFTLMPLVERWANCVHPVLKIDLRNVWEKCHDDLIVRLLDSK